MEEVERPSSAGARLEELEIQEKIQGTTIST